MHVRARNESTVNSDYRYEIDSRLQPTVMGNSHVANYALHSNNVKRKLKRITLRCKMSGSKTGAVYARECVVGPSPAPPPPTPPGPSTKSIPGRKKQQQQHTLLQPMPRCSSFMTVTTTTLLMPSKRPPVYDDRTYKRWKHEFELAPPAMMRSGGVHDISEAIAGQVTPKGFPSCTIVSSGRTFASAKYCWPRLLRPRREQRQCAAKLPASCGSDDNGDGAAGTRVQRRLSLRLPTFKCSPYAQRRAPTKRGNNNSVETPGAAPAKTHNNLLPDVAIVQCGAAQAKRKSSAPLNKQADIIEQLYREIRDLEEYYGRRTQLEYHHLHQPQLQLV